MSGVFEYSSPEWVWAYVTVHKLDGKRYVESLCHTYSQLFSNRLHLLPLLVIHRLLLMKLSSHLLLVELIVLPHLLLLMKVSTCRYIVICLRCMMLC